MKIEPCNSSDCCKWNIHNNLSFKTHLNIKKSAQKFIEKSDKLKKILPDFQTWAEKQYPLEDTVIVNADAEKSNLEFSMKFANSMCHIDFQKPTEEILDDCKYHCDSVISHNGYQDAIEKGYCPMHSMDILRAFEVRWAKRFGINF